MDGTTANAIQGDGSPYTNGSGVTAIINICSSTGDATLLPGSGRTDSGSFASPVFTNQYTPEKRYRNSFRRLVGPIDNTTEYQFTITCTSNQGPRRLRLPVCHPGQPETWHVRPLASSGHYMMSIPGGKDGSHGAGEFNMPFYLP